jgi:ribonuclease HII
MSISSLPTYNYEKELLANGYRAIVGVDEAGCGALAGPVVAGAVVLSVDSVFEGLKDSKLMTEKAREQMYPLVQAQAVAWAAGIVSADEIYEIGIRPATYLAMRRAIEGVESVDYVLVDAWSIPKIKIPQQGIIKGDTKVMSIAAASVIAKVTRDRIMRQMHEQFPQYGFDVHKGYGTKVHRDAIKTHGACAIHRLGYKTFN